MKKILLLTIVVFFTFTVSAQHKHTPMNTELDSVSYALGMNIANSFMSGGIDTLNYTTFIEGLNDVLVEKHAIMDGQDANKIVNDYVSRIKAEQSKSLREPGEKWLEANATKDGVIVLPNGLQYKVITQGDGAVPVDGQQVKTHYKGTLIDGKVFDSSYDRGAPATFNINQVIKGWTQILKMMPVGSKYEVYIPQNLAYGERAMGANIPPYSALVFTIELLEIVTN